jgi:mono/diheme cytochrome c family protein
MVNAGNYAYDLRKFPADQFERFLDSVNNGKNGRMPPWKDSLQTNEIKDIWLYVLTKGKS